MDDEPRKTIRELAEELRSAEPEPKAIVTLSFGFIDDGEDVLDPDEREDFVHIASAHIGNQTLCLDFLDDIEEAIDQLRHDILKRPVRFVDASGAFRRNRS